MKLSVIILSVLAIGFNIAAKVGQSANNNNLIISDLQSLISQTQQSFRAFLSTILVDPIIKNYYYTFTKNFSHQHFYHAIFMLINFTFKRNGSLFHSEHLIIPCI